VVSFEKRISDREQVCTYAAASTALRLEKVIMGDKSDCVVILESLSMLVVKHVNYPHAVAM
jgi:hypothetical protein